MTAQSVTDVSVVIPTRNGGPRLLQVFDALLRQKTGLRHDVIVIDSGSQDGSEQAARARGFRTLSIDPGDFNHGETRDRAIAASRAPAVALLVQDAVPADERWLDRLAAPLLEDDEAAGSFSRQVPIPGGNPILEQRLRNWIAGQEVARRARLEPPESWESLSPIERLNLVAFDNVAACIKRSCWIQHPFGRRPFGEDIAWATWAIRSGHVIRFHPDSIVEHSHDRSAWHEARRIYSDHRNLNLLLGLVTVPDLKTARRGREAALSHYLEVLEKAPLVETERDRRRAWARAYSWGEALAQWLAPKVNQARGNLLLDWIDRRLRRGI